MARKTLEEFKRTLNQPDPPAGLSTLLRALWLDGREDWEGAHDLVQHDQSQEAARIHAYLHRKEGDQGNAAYWYRLAGHEFCRDPLAVEWEDLVRSFLTD